MIQCKSGLVFAFILLVVLSGCGQSSQSGSSPSSADRGPDAIVAEFLEAVRTGDDTKAADLLTPLARRKTSEKEMVVAPPGSETAKFQVCDVKQSGQEADVATDWTDLDTDGRPHTDRIVWRLRRESEGWRIGGMATKVFPDQDAIFLNFEDPDDMVRRQQLAEEEIARRDREVTGAQNGSRSR